MGMVFNPCYPRKDSLDSESVEESKQIFRKPSPSPKEMQNWWELQIACTTSIIEHDVFTISNPEPLTFNTVQKDKLELTVSREHDCVWNPNVIDPVKRDVVTARRRAYTISTPIEGHQLSRDRPITLTISNILPSVSVLQEFESPLAAETSVVESGRDNQGVLDFSQSRLLFSIDPESVVSSSMSGEIKHELNNVSNPLLNISRQIPSTWVEPTSDFIESNGVELGVLQNTYTAFPCVIGISSSVMHSSTDPLLVQSSSAYCHIEPKRLSNTLLSISTPIPMISVEQDSESIDSSSGVGLFVLEKPYTVSRNVNFSVSNQVTLISVEQADDLSTVIGNAVPHTTCTTDSTVLNICRSLVGISVDSEHVQSSSALRHIWNNPKLTISNPVVLITVEPDSESIDEFSGLGRVDLQQTHTSSPFVNIKYSEEESSSWPIDFKANPPKVFEVSGRSSCISNILARDTSESSLIVFAEVDSNNLDQGKFLATKDESSSNPLNFDES